MALGLEDALYVQARCFAISIPNNRQQNLSTILHLMIRSLTIKQFQLRRYRKSRNLMLQETPLSAWLMTRYDIVLLLQPSFPACLSYYSLY
jgi:hypothetical protein